MKAKVFLWAFIAIFVSSCSVMEEEILDVDSVGRTFYAILEQTSSPETKVYTDDLKVLWDEDDRIAIFDNFTYGYQYKYVGTAASNGGKFDKVPREGGGFPFGNDIDLVCAVYPYNGSGEDKIIIDNSAEFVTLTLPSAQTYREDSFGRGANTMIAVGESDNKDEEMNLSFKNVCGYLSFKLYGDDISVSSITLMGKSKENIAGRAEINIALDKTPSLKQYTDPVSSITLECETPVKIGNTAETATVFWMVVPPTVFNEGFTVSIKDSKERVCEKKRTHSLEVKRSCLTRMAPFEVKY